MQHHVIYVTGLGDQKAKGQKLVTKLWRVFGVHGVYHPMYWGNKEAFGPKLERLLAEIDELAADGSKVSLIGTSAGASAALIAYGLRPNKIAGVACICGKINHPETISPHRFVENPAFKESLAELQRTLPKLDAAQRARILSVHPLYDGMVPVADTRIPGAVEKTIPLIGHVLAIAGTLIFLSGTILRFLKQQISVD